MTDDLKPCPFCGHEAAAFHSSWDSDDYDVGCFNGECPVKPHPWRETKAEAIAAWNTRAKPIPTDAYDLLIKLEAAEAKLAKAVAALNKAKAYITDLEEHEGAEGFSRSTAVFMGEYYDALTELEKTE